MFLITALLFSATCILHAQSASVKKVYISRPKSPHASLIKFKLLVNGAPLTMPNNSYAELSINADSVKVEVANAPAWMKEGASISSKDSVVYLSVYAHYPGGTKKEVIVIEKVCKTCYEDNIRIAKKKIELE